MKKISSTLGAATLAGALVFLGTGLAGATAVPIAHALPPPTGAPLVAPPIAVDSRGAVHPPAPAPTMAAGAAQALPASAETTLPEPPSPLLLVAAGIAIVVLRRFGRRGQR